MPTFVIERSIPAAQDMSRRELSEISQASLAVLQQLGPDITWLHSYVVEDKIFCVYEAAGPEVIREHARRGNFPIDNIACVAAVIGPQTAKE